MEINITFFVQMIHFFIGWVILKYWFLRPTLTCLQQEKKEGKKRGEVVEKLRNEVIMQKQKKVVAWKESQSKFSARRPDLSGLKGAYRFEDESAAKKPVLDGTVIRNEAEAFSNELVRCLELPHD